MGRWARRHRGRIFWRLGCVVLILALVVGSLGTLLVGLAAAALGVIGVAWSLRLAALGALALGVLALAGAFVSVRRLSASGFSHSARAKSVFTRPGAMQLTRTFFGPHSTARLRASAKSAALEIP